VASSSYDFIKAKKDMKIKSIVKIIKKIKNKKEKEKEHD
jgi:hypothetical protein